MRDFTNRPNNRRHTARFFMGVAGIIALGFITFGAANAAWGMYGKFNEAAVGDADAQANLSMLKAQDAQMSAKVRDISSERGIEAQIRQSYGVALPGEGQIQIVREAPTSTPTEAPKPGILSRVWHALFVW